MHPPYRLIEFSDQVGMTQPHDPTPDLSPHRSNPNPNPKPGQVNVLDAACRANGTYVIKFILQRRLHLNSGLFTHTDTDSTTVTSDTNSNANRTRTTSVLVPNGNVRMLSLSHVFRVYVSA